MTLPENGITSYFYNTDRTLNYKTDAKGQRTDCVYETGPAKRVTQVKHTPYGSAEDLCQQVNHTYDSNSLFGSNLNGRLATAIYNLGTSGTACANGAGQITEMYSYHAEGMQSLREMGLRGSGQCDCVAQEDHAEQTPSRGFVV